MRCMFETSYRYYSFGSKVKIFSFLDFLDKYFYLRHIKFKRYIMINFKKKKKHKFGR